MGSENDGEKTSHVSLWYLVFSTYIISLSLSVPIQIFFEKIIISPSRPTLPISPNKLCYSDKLGFYIFYIEEPLAGFEFYGWILKVNRVKNH